MRRESYLGFMKRYIEAQPSKLNINRVVLSLIVPFLIDSIVRVDLIEVRLLHIYSRRKGTGEVLLTFISPEDD